MSQWKKFEPKLRCKVEDKEQSIKNYIRYMMARTQQMFKYENLPDTIPERMLELYLQYNGTCIIGKANDGNLYAFTGGAGGEHDAYYRPTKYTVANPFLKFNKVFTIGKDCILMNNDSMWLGLYPLYERYAYLLEENDISIKIAEINLRQTALLSANNDKTKKSAELYLKQLEDGKLGIIADNPLLDENGIKAQPLTSSNANTITQLIELKQYLKAGWYNDIGLNANYNMKRESINADEAQMNNDALIPLIEDMYNCRKEKVDAVNKMFNTNISVEYNSVWDTNNKLITELQVETEPEPEKEPVEPSKEEKAPEEKPKEKEEKKDEAK